MATGFTKLIGSELLSDTAVADINSCFIDTQSTSANPALPTTELYVGMLHFNTPAVGQPYLVVLESLNPSVWTKLHSSEASPVTGIVGDLPSVNSTSSTESTFGLVNTTPVTSGKSSSLALLSPSSIKTHMYANTVDPGVVLLASTGEIAAGTITNKAIPYSNMSSVPSPPGDTASALDPGYHRYANGLTYCWGKTLNVAYGQTGKAVTYPTSMTQVFNVNVTMAGGWTTTQGTTVCAHNVSTSGFTIKNLYAGKSSAGTRTVDAYWLAIGLS